MLCSNTKDKSTSSCQNVYIFNLSRITILWGGNMAIAGLNLDARIVRHGELRSLFAKNTSAAFATLANVFHNSRTNMRNLKNTFKNA